MKDEEFQKLCLSIVEISNYCDNHNCDLNCDFFLLGKNCIFLSGKPPSKWTVPTTIIKGMRCKELEPDVIEEEQNDKSIKKGDENASQESNIP